jgi:hypothetical protein
MSPRTSRRETTIKENQGEAAIKEKLTVLPKALRQ